MSKLGDRKSAALARLVNYVSFDKTITFTKSFTKSEFG